jgi:hypothetical protein
MSVLAVDRVDSPGTLPENPFPGLRPYESHEAPLFFGRDEQCDDLLARLARRRLVAVLGMSGSGKSSLVRAGLLPALSRGYVPSAGSAWHIATFRPGSDPMANLTHALANRHRPSKTHGKEQPAQIRALLDASSLGLAAAARALAPESGESLLVVADQFEEIFRFGRIARTAEAREQAAACVDLLVNASQQDQVPVYVVLTMRSDYLGDCTQFIGLPEALNDSQFLVPRMTRAQLRAAIESPVAVCGARITPRLVQRLLYDVDQRSLSSDIREGAPSQDQDQLPVLQHALMRVWEVARPARERGEPIDLPHYEQPPVETLRHSLDRHAEEVYASLPSDRHRDVARLIFQRLTDRDAENREVRRPTTLRELVEVGLHFSPGEDRGKTTAAQREVVEDVVAVFAAEGRAFLVRSAQQDVDISHESFIRKWQRLHAWVDREHRSARIFGALSDTAVRWARDEASLYRGPELAEARRWWQEERPTAVWAERYGDRFEVADRFLSASARRRRLRLGLLFGNIALLLGAAVTVALLMVASRNEARRAEAAALEARNAAEASRADRAAAEKFRTLAEDASRRGDLAQAEALKQRALLADLQANSRQVLTPGELAELTRLRQSEREWQATEATLRRQLNSQRAQGPDSTAGGAQLSAADRSELDRLRKAEAAWQQEKIHLEGQLVAANDRASKLQQSESALKKSNDDLQAKLKSPAPTSSPSSSVPSLPRGSPSSSSGSQPSSLRDRQETRKPFRTVIADENGRYTSFLSPGTYSVQFELIGFRTVRYENISVSSSRGARVDAVMEIAAVAETVTVGSGARRAASGGMIVGTVTDASGGVLPGVSISFYQQ